MTTLTTTFTLNSPLVIQINLTFFPSMFPGSSPEFTFFAGNFAYMADLPIAEQTFHLSGWHMCEYVFVASFHPSRIRMSGSSESIEMHACTTRPRFKLSSKRVVGSAVWTYVNSKGKILSTRWLKGDAALSRAAMCWLVALHPSSILVSLRDGSATPR